MCSFTGKKKPMGDLGQGALGNITSLYKVRIPSARREGRERRDPPPGHRPLLPGRLGFLRQHPGHGDGPPRHRPGGRCHFHTSDEGERHQLELRYKMKSVEDILEYAYLRFSVFGRRHDQHRLRRGCLRRRRCRSRRARGDRARAPLNAGGRGTFRPPPRATGRIPFSAASIPLTFTIEDSLTRDRLSFIRQTDQVLFDFKGKDKGDMAYINSPFSDEEIHFKADPDKLINLYSPEKEEPGGPREMFISFGQKYDVQRCDLELDFQPEKFYLSARPHPDLRPRSTPWTASNFRSTPRHPRDSTRAAGTLLHPDNQKPSCTSTC